MRGFFHVTAIFLILVAPAGRAVAQSKQEHSCAGNTSKIMILGTYHMNNPGLDTYNLKADDVLSDRRQKEIDEVLGKLQRFNPTKIAFEGQYNEDYWTSRYKEYLAGTYQLGRNEIEQIAFKLAKRLGHAAIYPVDYEMWMDGRVPAEIADPVVKPKPSQPANAGPVEPPDWIKQREELFKKSTVLEYLRFLNSDEGRRPDHASYMDMLLPDDTNAPYGRADLVANWYKRNLRIFVNVNRIAKSPGDRILLVIGSGHETILADFARSSTYFCLVSAEDYLK
jgi:hypothetical protein